MAPTCWEKELLGATAQTGRAAQARLVPEHLGRAQNKLLRTRLEPSFIHGAPEALQHMQARAPHHAATCSLVCTIRRRTQKHVPHPPLFLPDCATHARPLLPAALAFVPFGFVLARVRVASVFGETNLVGPYVASSNECGRPSQVKSRFTPRGYIEQGATCHGACPRSGRGRGCKRCSSSLRLCGMSVRARALRF